jgi:hypothetical protein
LQTSDIVLTPYYLADEIRVHYAGMMMAVAFAAWERYDMLTSAQLGRVLMQIAKHANPWPCESIPAASKSSRKRAMYQDRKHAVMLLRRASLKKEGLIEDLERGGS